MTTYETIISRLKAVAEELNNTSVSALYKRLVSAFSETVNTVLLNISNSETVIENSARTLRVMGRQYYIDTALAFQMGDNLVLIDPATHAYGYNPVDPSKQIIKQVVVRVDADDKLIYMNVCAQDGSGNNSPLTESQLAEFTTYMNAKSCFGISILISSPQPSTISASNLYIRYLDTYSLTQIKQGIKEVLITTQGTLLGDSPVFVNDIESALSGVPGVRDAYFVGINCDGQLPVNGILSPSSGYFNFSAELQELGPSVVFNSMR